MSDYLDNLVARNHNPQVVLQPRSTSLFEPLPGTGALSRGPVDLRSENHEPVLHEAVPGEATSEALLPIGRRITPRSSTPQALSTRRRDPKHDERPPVANIPPGLKSPAVVHFEAASQLPSEKVNGSTSATIVAQPRVTPHVPPRAPDSRPSSQVESAPTVRVTIGRIDVRAILPPTPRAHRAAPSGPKLSLEEYLKQRNGEQR